jgi:hypothetical protein
MSMRRSLLALLVTTPWLLEHRCTHLVLQMANFAAHRNLKFAPTGSFAPARLWREGARTIFAIAMTAGG